MTDVIQEVVYTPCLQYRSLGGEAVSSISAPHLAAAGFSRPLGVFFDSGSWDLSVEDSVLLVFKEQMPSLAVTAAPQG